MSFLERWGFSYFFFFRAPYYLHLPRKLHSWLSPVIQVPAPPRAHQTRWRALPTLLCHIPFLWWIHHPLTFSWCFNGNSTACLLRWLQSVKRCLALRERPVHESLNVCSESFCLFSFSAPSPQPELSLTLLELECHSSGDVIRLISCHSDRRLLLFSRQPSPCVHHTWGRVWKLTEMSLHRLHFVPLNHAPVTSQIHLQLEAADIFFKHLLDASTCLSTA